MPQAGVSVAPDELGRYESWDEVAAEAFNFPRRGVSAGARRTGARAATRSSTAAPHRPPVRTPGQSRPAGPYSLRDGATDHTPPPVAAAVSRPTADPRTTSRSTDGPPVRRTVTIRGYGAERNLVHTQSRRRSTRPYERSGFKPDRAAMWAVLLGVLLVLVAASSSRGAVRDHVRATSHTAAAVVVIRSR